MATTAGLIRPCQEPPREASINPADPGGIAVIIAPEPGAADGVRRGDPGEDSESCRDVQVVVRVGFTEDEVACRVVSCVGMNFRGHARLPPLRRCRNPGEGRSRRPRARGPAAHLRRSGCRRRRVPRNRRRTHRPVWIPAAQRAAHALPEPEAQSRECLSNRRRQVLPVELMNAVPAHFLRACYALVDETCQALPRADF